MPSSQRIPKLIHKQTGKKFLLNKRETLIGRIPRENEGVSPDIPVSDPLVSRKHAIITVDNQEYFVRNFGRNGTFVNGKEIRISDVNPGDEIRLGNTVFHFIIEDEEEASHKLALIVDSDVNCVRCLEKILQEENYECTDVTSGTEAIEELLSKRFSLVVTEVFIPKLDGFELCRFIRRQPDMDKLTIVILTYLSNAPEVAHGIQQGANFYLSKPLNSDALKKCLKKIRERREK